MTVTRVTLSDECQSALLSVRGAPDAGTWAVARALADWEKVSIDDNPGMSREEVYAALSDYAGIAPSTVRPWIQTAKRWPPDMVSDLEQYPVTFSHFRYARTADDLAWCIKSADDYGGMIAPVRALQMRVKKRDGKELQWNGVLGIILSAIKRLLVPASPKQREALRVIAAQLEDMRK